MTPIAVAEHDRYLVTENPHFTHEDLIEASVAIDRAFAAYQQAKASGEGVEEARVAMGAADSWERFVRHARLVAERVTSARDLGRGVLFTETGEFYTDHL